MKRLAANRRAALLAVAAAATAAAAVVVTALVLLPTRQLPAAIPPVPPASPSRAAPNPATGTAVTSPIPTLSTATPTASRTAPNSTPLSPTDVAPTLPLADRQDADQVAVTAMTTLYTFDTRVDHDQADSARRALYLLTPTLAARLTTPAADGPSATWQVWSHNQSRSTATVHPRQLPWALPADTTIRATRVVVVEQSIHDGARITQQEPLVLQLTLTRHEAGTAWRVDRIEEP